MQGKAKIQEAFSVQPISLILGEFTRNTLIRIYFDENEELSQMRIFMFLPPKQAKLYKINWSVC